jgi:nitrite reductase/ring-hydroxylating ferredoxin subunit
LTGAVELAPAAYFDPAIWGVEMREIFGRSWLLVGRSDEIAEVGAFFTWQRTQIPFVLMRGVDRKVRAFYNSCRHRGAPVVRTPAGRARAFRCQYHSWTYDTFGTLLAVPDERDFGEVDRCAYSLVPVQLAEIGGWLWINQDPTAEPVGRVLGEAEPDLERLEAGFHFAERRVVTVSSNWKAVVERLADMATDLRAGGRLVVSHLPNVMMLQTPEELMAVMAWPADERTTDVEVLRCVPASAQIDDSAWRQGWDDLEASVRRGLDRIPLSGAQGQASRRMAGLLAATYGPRLGEIDA